MTLTFGSLFTGGGIADLGFQAAGMEHAWGVEIDAAACEVANANIGNVRCMDILTADPCRFDKVDFLHASPPCPNFSAANTQKGEKQLDIDFAKKICEFLVAQKPKYFMLENVEAYKRSHSFNLIVETLNELGYWLNYQALNAADFGVRQSRRRLILQAVRGGFVPSLPQPERHLGWYDGVSDLLDNLKDTKFADWQLKKLKADPSMSFVINGDQAGKDLTSRKADDPIFTVTASVHKGMPRAYLVHPTDQRTMPIIDDLDPSFTLTTNQGGNKLKALLIENTGARSDRPLQTRAESEPCWTIRAMGHDGHWHRANALLNSRVVALDYKCLARLQSIPDGYIWADRVITNTKIIGNSFPTLMAQKIAANLTSTN